jgi:hypothetical protein
VNYEIVQLEEFIGSKATIYSILPQGENETLFDIFISSHYKDYSIEIEDILHTLEMIAKKIGARENLFRPNEGKPGDGLVALFDNPGKKLRLYTIRYGSTILIVGGGGVKTKETRRWQDSPKLKAEAEMMIQISKEIFQRIKDKEIQFTTDGMEIYGNLNFTHNDAE